MWRKSWHYAAWKEFFGASWQFGKHGTKKHVRCRWFCAFRNHVRHASNAKRGIGKAWEGWFSSSRRSYSKWKQHVFTKSAIILLWERRMHGEDQRSVGRGTYLIRMLLLMRWEFALCVENSFCGMFLRTTYTTRRKWHRADFPNGFGGGWKDQRMGSMSLFLTPHMIIKSAECYCASYSRRMSSWWELRERSRSIAKYSTERYYL